MRKRILPIAIAAVLLIPLVYLAYHLLPVIFPEYDTQTAIVYTLADGVDVTGVAVRSERAISGSAEGGTVGYLVEDGSRVSGGSVVAEIYAGQEQANQRARENALTTELEMLNASQDPAQTSEGNVGVILKQQMQNLYQLQKTIASGYYDTLQEDRAGLTKSANMLQIATGKTPNFDDRIAAITAERDAAAAAVGQVTYLSSDTTGYFSAITDGEEATYTESYLDSLPAADLETLLATPLPQQGGQAGKIVQDYKWYFYFVVDAAAAQRFDEDKDGKVTIDFHYTGAEEVPANIVSITPDAATGKSVVKLVCTYINHDTINLRVQHASVNFKSYTGIRVDRDALHIVKDERGVYVRFGNLVQFKKVSPLFENDNYALLPVQYTVEDPKNQVVVYDEIIVAGKNLYDNKLL